MKMLLNFKRKKVLIKSKNKLMEEKIKKFKRNQKNKNKTKMCQKIKSYKILSNKLN
jgi:hypothetical protein